MLAHKSLRLTSKTNQNEQSENKESEKTHSRYIFWKVEYQLVKMFLLKEIAYVEHTRLLKVTWLKNLINLSLTSLKSMEELLPPINLMRGIAQLSSPRPYESVSKMSSNGKPVHSVGDNYKKPFLEFMNVAGWLSVGEKRDGE